MRVTATCGALAGFAFVREWLNNEGGGDACDDGAAGLC